MPTLETSNFKVLDHIGKGAYGNVYRSRSDFDGRIYALKEICYQTLSEPDRRHIEHEMSISRDLSSPQIVNYYGGFIFHHKLYLILEYCPESDLATYIKDRSRTTIPECVIWRCLRHILLALNECTRAGIIHRDVKPANIMLCQGSDGKLNAKLGDFGLACRVNEAHERSPVGTPYYMAPEIFKHPPRYSVKSDIWSLGCTIYEMASSKPPFITSVVLRLEDKIKMGSYTEAPLLSYTQDLRDVIRRMLTVDAGSRPSIDELLKIVGKD